jgi:hypothetical protein
MKRILSSPSPIEVTQLKAMLEDSGIPCFVRNEVSAGLIGEIPISEATPELWIEHDDKLEEALRVKKDWQAGASAVGGAWVCAVCGETSEAQFSSCWKCGAPR